MKAGVAAGCDAIYMGGKQFGARAFATNAIDTELLEALDYLHLRDKKCYVTANTLIKDSQFHSLYDFIKPLYEHGLDAVIVQDMGVMHFLHENFPELELHAPAVPSS